MSALLAALASLGQRILAWILSILTDPAKLFKAFIYCLVFVVGFWMGGWIGGRRHYNRGYDAGYVDGKAGSRKKIFPWLFGAPAPVEEEAGTDPGTESVEVPEDGTGEQGSEAVDGAEESSAAEAASAAG